MRVIAILATYNEERFIGACLKNLRQQGVDVYLLDNQSSDRTVEIAREHLDCGLIGMETIPRDVFRLRVILQRKEELAASLDADWFMHVDADEIHLPPRPDITLAAALRDAEVQGYNAVNFQEYTFIPTKEHPDHDHDRFEQTMRWYYPLMPPYFPNRINAWKHQPHRVELAWSGGHQVRFSGLTLYPQSFPMKHYLFLSLDQVIRKYGARRHDPTAVKEGFHTWRARFDRRILELPSETQMKEYHFDGTFDDSNPWSREWLEQLHDLDLWNRQIPLAARELAEVVPREARLILVDENRLGDEIVGERAVMPFTQRDGRYWGPPADDQSAIDELECLRCNGAQFLAIAWPAFWWLEHFPAFANHLRQRFHCPIRTDRIVVFDLRNTEADRCA